METARWKGSVCPPATSRDLRVTSIFPGRVAFVVIITLTLLTLCLVTAPGQARASGGGKITFTAPIYSGQNGGNPEGPVGAQVTVHGSGWMPNAQVDLSVADKAGDTPGTTGSACTNGKVPLYTAENTRSDGSGKVIAVFLWPDGANKVGHSYWVCALVSGKTFRGTNTYTVLSAQAPSDAISVAQATAGGVITVTGQNWLPGKQTIRVTIAPSLSGQPPYSSTAQTTATSGGSFSVAI